MRERVSNFCEYTHLTGLAQPVNAWSSLAFVVVALGLVWYFTRSGRLLAGNKAYAWFFAFAVALIGIGSFAGHGTQTHWGGQLDLASMFLLISLAILLSINRLLKLKAPVIFGLVVLLNIPLAYLAGFSDAVTYNLFAVLVFVLITSEVLQLLHDRTLPQQYFWLALGSLVVAYGAWQLDTRRIWCDPQSLWQGHALWHILCAVASGLLYLHFNRTLREPA